MNQNEKNTKQRTLYSVNKSKFSKNERKFFLKQASLLKELTDHSGIASLSHIFKAKNQQFYIFEKNSDLSLAEYLVRSEKRPDLNFIKKVAFDLLSTLQNLHHQGIVHLDLNPNNIMVVNEQELSLNSDESSSESDCLIIQSGGAPISPTAKKMRDSLFNITNFFMSSGIEKKKFSSNKISSLYFMSP